MPSNPARDRAVERRARQQPSETAHRATRPGGDRPTGTVKRRAAAAHIAFLPVDGCFFGWLCRTGSTELGLRQRPLLERVMAGGDVAVFADAVELRRLDVAMPGVEARAAGVEPARRRRVDRVRDVALEHDRLARAAERRGPGSAQRTSARRCTGASAAAYSS